MKNILLTVDFENSETQLLDVAFQYAKAFKAKVWLLHVASPEPEFVGFGVGPQYIRDSRAEQLRKEHRKIQAYADLLRDRGLKAEGLLIKGTTIGMILEEAEKLHVDLIITGRHEHGLLYKAFFGSVSKGVIKKSKIPVLLVPID